MKIALCLSGQPRSFKQGYSYHKEHLLDYHDVDVFIHTWAVRGIEELNILYRPKAMLVESSLEGNFDQMYINTPDAIRHPPRFTVSMLYSMWQSSNLREEYEKKHKFKYDWVIKSRTDFALNTLIPFELLNPDLLYIPNERTVPTRDFGNDQFAFGGSDVMSKRMGIYENIDRFYNEGVQMIGEDMMSAQIKFHNLTGDRLVYVSMNNPFPPGKYNGTWHSLIRDDCDEWKKK